MSGLWAQGSYGLDILKYTETLSAVTRTSLPNEILRGLGYWFFYGRDKLGPWIEASTDYTQKPYAIILSYGIPVLALLSAAFVRWRHRAYFILVMFVGVVIAVGAHPYNSPTPFGKVFKKLATESTAAFALRSTGRATPLVVLGLACLLAAGVNASVAWLTVRRRRTLGYVLAAAIGVLVIVNLPALWNNTFYGKNLQRPEDVPQYWKDAAAYLDKQPDDTRVLELPGRGLRVVPLGQHRGPDHARHHGPALRRSRADPVRLARLGEPAQRLRPAHPGSSAAGRRDLADGAHDERRRHRVAQRSAVRALPADPPRVPLAALHAAAPGVGGADAVRFAGREPGLAVPVPGRAGARWSCEPGDPATRRDLPGHGPGEDRPREAEAGSVVIAGDGDGMVDASVARLLDANPLVFYSAGFAADPAKLNAEVDRGATLVVTDSNRDQARRWSTVTDTLGYTVGPGTHPLEKDLSDSRLEMFPDAKEDAFTTTKLVGAKGVAASDYGNPITYTPEDRAARAFDGNVKTAWRTGAFDDVTGDRIRIVLDHPITTDHINLVQSQKKPNERYVTERAAHLRRRVAGRHHPRSAVASARRPDGPVPQAHLLDVPAHDQGHEPRHPPRLRRSEPGGVRRDPHA